MQDGVIIEGHRALGTTMPFYVEHILQSLEGGRYVVPILPDTLEELVDGICGSGSSGGGGSSSRGIVNEGVSGRGISAGTCCSRRNRVRGVGVGKYGAAIGTGGSGYSVRVQVQYETHLPALSLWNG